MQVRPSVEMLEGVSIGYSSVLARVALDVTLGEGTHYLLARNGRGKTTLLRSVAGVLKLKAGCVERNGVMQFVPEDIDYDAHLRPVDILKSLVPKARWDACFAFAREIELDLKKSYRSLSTGNKRKVSWLMAEFSCDPNGGNILLLDEPFTGLDSYVREKIMEYWEENSEGVCRLVSCHPDFDSMRIESAVLISDAEITAPTSTEMQSWGQLKQLLK